MRSYARYLGLDSDPLAAAMPVQPHHAQRSFGLGSERPRTRLVLTAPVAVVIGLAVLASVFGLYAWRQVESLNNASGEHPVAHLAVPSPLTNPMPPSPSPQPRSIVVVVSVTDVVWLSVIVDGKPQYGDSGRILQPGSEVAFAGVDIKITSGKAAATFITIDGHPIGALGDGVVTREFKAT